MSGLNWQSRRKKEEAKGVPETGVPGPKESSFHLNLDQRLCDRNKEVEKTYQQKILNVFKENQDRWFSAKDIAEASGVQNKQNLKSCLGQLVFEEKLEAIGEVGTKLRRWKYKGEV